MARLGSFTKAAEALGYSEPAIHLQVSALRDIVRGRLFVRVSGRMELTELGRQLLPLAEQSLDAADELARRALENRSDVQRTVRLGITRFLGSYVYPTIEVERRDRIASTDLSIALLPRNTIVQQVLHDQLDLALGSELAVLFEEAHVGSHTLACVPWLHFPWRILATKHAVERLDEGGAILPFLLPSSAESMVEPLRESLNRDGARSQIVLVESPEAAVSGALAELGAACLPTYASQLAVETKRLVPYGDQHRLPPTSVHLVHRRPTLNPNVVNVVRFLRNIRHLVLSASA